MPGARISEGACFRPVPARGAFVFSRGLDDGKALLLGLGVAAIAVAFFAMYGQGFLTNLEAVAEIADEFRGASASVVTEYRGLTVAQLTRLRRTLGPDVSYRIAKNTLVKNYLYLAEKRGLEVRTERVEVRRIAQVAIGPVFPISLALQGFEQADPENRSAGARDADDEFHRWSARPTLTRRAGSRTWR